MNGLWINSANNSSKIVNITPGVLGAYGNTARPSYSTTRDPNYNSLAVHSNTSVNTYKWEYYTYNESTSAYELVSNQNDKISATIILKPENENGLRSYVYASAYKIHNYTTRSGYGFSIHTSFSDLQLTTKRSNVKASSTVGKVTAYMLYPEFNYEAKSGKCTDLVAAKSGSVYLLSLPKYDDITSSDNNDKYAHYIPMWYPDGLYKPVTVIGGLWTPVGELRASVLQGELTTKTQMDTYGIYTNTYTISGSLYDDLYESTTR